jgi:dUTP pyrophosphatase
VVLRLNVKRVRPDGRIPSYAHDGDAGLDLYAAEASVLQPGGSVLVPTGIAISLPPGTEGQVRPRSGLALDSRVTVLNAPGTIDEGYRGEVGVILINHSTTPFAIELGMKIAQLVVAPRLEVEIAPVEDLDETSRGSGGFGSTGTGT